MNTWNACLFPPLRFSRPLFQRHLRGLSSVPTMDGDEEDEEDGRRQRLLPRLNVRG